MISVLQNPKPHARVTKAGRDGAKLYRNSNHRRRTRRYSERSCLSRIVLRAARFAPSSFVAELKRSAKITAMTELKKSFRESRTSGNIEVVLPVFKAASLHVIVRAENSTIQNPEWFLTASPTKGRFCVTVSESVDALISVRWPKLEITGRLLLQILSPDIEIVIVYADGGDYITREHLAWYRQIDSTIR